VKKGGGHLITVAFTSSTFDGVEVVAEACMANDTDNVCTRLAAALLSLAQNTFDLLKRYSRHPKTNVKDRFSPFAYP